MEISSMNRTRTFSTYSKAQKTPHMTTTRKEVSKEFEWYDSVGYKLDQYDGWVSVESEDGDDRHISGETNLVVRPVGISSNVRRAVLNSFSVGSPLTGTAVGVGALVGVGGVVAVDMAFMRSNAGVSA